MSPTFWSPSSDSIEGEKLLQMVVSRRANLDYGRISIRSEYFRRPDVTVGVKLDFVFDGERLRVDRDYDGDRIIGCFGCYGDHHVSLLSLIHI